MLRTLKIGWVGWLMMCSLALFAVTTEQEQQFKYYWYAARQAITEERYSDAYALLQFCQAIRPDDPQTLSFLGILYAGTGQKEIGMDYYRRAYEADPHHQWYHYSKALLEEHTADANEAAIQVLQHAYDVQKEAVKKKQTAFVEEDLLERLQNCYLYKSQWKEALRLQDELDLQHGYDANSALMRAQIYSSWKKPKKTLAALEKYLENDPTNLRFLAFRLDALQAMKVKPAVLSKAYREFLELDPYNLLILNNYAYHIATHGGDLNEAERMSAITIREQPNNPIFLDTYGWILHLQGKDELALFYLQRAQWKAAEGDKEVQAEIIMHLNKVNKR